MREWMTAAVVDNGHSLGYPSVFAVGSKSSVSHQMDGFKAFAKELGKKDYLQERLAWLSGFHADEGKQARWLGWGIEGYWLACVLERDDENEFESMLNAGCDPWSLAFGLHPLDSAWRLNAKRCAKILCKHICPMEKAGQMVLQKDAMKWHLIYKSNMPIMSSMYFQGKSLEGYGSNSNVPSLAKAWQQSMFDPEHFGSHWYLSHLASPSRSQADAELLGPLEEMSVSEALLYWQKHADDKTGQPQWVESLTILDQLMDSIPSEKGPRL